MRNKTIFMGFLITISFVLPCLGMDPPTIQKDTYTIDELFATGVIHDDLNLGDEKARAVKLSLMNNKAEALKIYFECARRGDSASMYQIGFHAYKVNDFATAKAWLLMAVFISYQQTGIKNAAAVALLEKMGENVSSLEDQRSSRLSAHIPNTAALAAAKPRQEMASHQGPEANLYGPLVDMFGSSLAIFSSVQASLSQLKQVQRAAENLKSLGNTGATLEEQLLSLQTFGSLCGELARDSEKNIQTFLPASQMGKIEQEIKTQFSDETLRLRARAFLFLATEPNSMATFFIYELQETTILSPLETMTLTEKLLTWIEDNWEISRGKTPEQYFALSLPSLAELRWFFQEQIITILLDETRNDAANLKEEIYQEIYKRCLALNTSYTNYVIGDLIYNRKLFPEFTDEQRISEASKLFFTSTYHGSFVRLGQIYLHGDLGKELPPKERIEKALKFFDQCEEEWKLVALLKLFEIEQYEYCLNYAQKFINANASEKGLLSDAIFECYRKLMLMNKNPEELQALCIKLLDQATTFNELSFPISVVSQSILEYCQNYLLQVELSSYASSLSTHEKFLLEKNREIAPQVLKLPKPSPDLLMTLKFGKVELLVELHSKRVLRQNENLTIGERIKIRELLQDIAQKPWALEGSGKPEILKNFGTYGGCFSRRISDEHRLIYKPVGSNKIVVYSCEGHPYGRSI